MQHAHEGVEVSRVRSCRDTLGTCLGLGLRDCLAHLPHEDVFHSFDLRNAVENSFLVVLLEPLQVNKRHSDLADINGLLRFSWAAVLEGLLAGVLPEDLLQLRDQTFLLEEKEQLFNFSFALLAQDLALIESFVDCGHTKRSLGRGEGLSRLAGSALVTAN